MLKVLKNLKKSWVSVVIIIILLCIQASVDLALPDYTSRIVNVGIQAGGIQTAVPEVISKEDMDNIRMELEKLICFTMGRDVVTDEDVEEICAAQAVNKIFEMIGAIASRQTRKAMDLYEDLLTLREPPMRILFLIARQFNQILQVKELMGKGMERNAIAGKMKIQPFIVGKTMPQARSFTREQILSYVGLCAQLEEDVKTGRLSDRLAVELLLTKEYGKN